MNLTDSHAAVRRPRHAGFPLSGAAPAEPSHTGAPDGPLQGGQTPVRGPHTPPDGPTLHAAELPPPVLGREERISAAVRTLIAHCRAAEDRHERRRQDRIDFIQPVIAQTEDGRKLALLSRDISLTGIRLIASHALLGQKLLISLPGEPALGPGVFLVRVVWACEVGDALYENGACFLEVLPARGAHLRLVGGEEDEGDACDDGGNRFRL